MAWKIEQIAWGGWERCFRLTDNRIELIITAEVGPRVIRCGFVGGENHFFVDDSAAGQTGGGDFRMYGGHRFWHAPEQQPRTYYPDNAPVSVEEIPNGARFTAQVEQHNHVQKTLEITGDGKRIIVRHILTNAGRWPIEIAPWGLSVMAPGGRAVIPLPPRAPHPEALLPANTLTLWPYTDLSDPRWTWGSRYILLQQDPKATVPQKIGANLPDGWLAYVRNSEMFVKWGETYDDGATFPDMNSNIEVFTDANMLELETLGPLGLLQPGAQVSHTEHWALFADVPVPWSGEDVVEDIVPLIEGS